MVFGFSSKNKWKENKSCFEYVNVFHDLTNDTFLVVLDSDMNEFTEEYVNELNDKMFLNVEEYGDIE